MARKTPIRHYVGMHRRKGKLVKGYERGHGTATAKKAKKMPSPSYLNKPEKLTPFAKELSEKGQVILEVNLPYGADTPKKERNFMWKNYHIDIGTDPDNEEEYEKLFYGGDLRSEMGLKLEDGVFVIWPKYYVPGYEEYWNALVKNSTYHEEW